MLNGDNSTQKNFVLVLYTLLSKVLHALWYYGFDGDLQGGLGGGLSN
jgi:hypothetical protein